MNVYAGLGFKLSAFLPSLLILLGALGLFQILSDEGRSLHYLYVVLSLLGMVFSWIWYRRICKLILVSMKDEELRIQPPICREPINLALADVVSVESSNRVISVRTKSGGIFQLYGYYFSRKDYERLFELLARSVV